MPFSLPIFRYDQPLGKLVRLPLALIPKNLVVPVFGGQLRGMKWIVGASSHGCWLGSVEPEKQNLFSEIISEGDVFYDIGGHVGLHTLLASKLVGSSGQVYTFEPFPRNIEFLKRHISLNKLENIELHECAVSDVEGTVAFEDGGGDSSEGRIAKEGSIQVPAITLDTFVAQEGVRPPTHLKIDVEGAELMVLQGARETLASHHPVVVLATHGDEVKESCLTFLKELGYQIEPLQLQEWQEEDEFIARHSSANA